MNIKSLLCASVAALGLNAAPLLFTIAHADPTGCSTGQVLGSVGGSLGCVIQSTFGGVNVTASTIPANGLSLSAANVPALSASSVNLFKWDLNGTSPEFIYGDRTNGTRADFYLVGSGGNIFHIGANQSDNTILNMYGSNFLTLQTNSTNAIIITPTQGVKISAISTDSGLTDATVCEDTTNHQLYFGSGTLGVCLGTSSMRYKHDIAALVPGLDAIMALKPISYKINADHGDPNKTLYGFTAEQGGQVLPALMTKDAAGQPNTFDYLGVVPVLVKAVQDEQAEIVALKDEVQQLKRMNATLTSLH